MQIARTCAVISFAALLASAAVAQQAPPQTQTQPQKQAPQATQDSGVKAKTALGSAGRDFVMKASRGDRFELESSRRALEKSSDAEVRQFAQRMIDDHTRASEQLKQVVDRIGANVPAEPAFDAKQKSAMRRLDRAGQGVAFDRAYMAAQVQAHTDAVSLYRRYSQRGDNQQLKEFATSTLPILEQHTDHAKQLQKRIGQQTSSKEK